MPLKILHEQRSTTKHDATKLSSANSFARDIGIRWSDHNCTASRTNLGTYRRDSQVLGGDHNCPDLSELGQKEASGYYMARVMGGRRQHPASTVDLGVCYHRAELRHLDRIRLDRDYLPAEKAAMEEDHGGSCDRLRF